MSRPAAALLAAGLWLLPTGLGAQGLRRGYFRAEIGTARLHSLDDQEQFVGFHIGRAIDPAGGRRWDLGFKLEGGEGSFAALTIGHEWRYTPAAMVSPVFGVGIGLLRDSDQSVGASGYLTGAVEVGPASDVGLRFGLELGFHERSLGPNILFAGIEIRGRGVR